MISKLTFMNDLLNFYLHCIPVASIPHVHMKNVETTSTTFLALNHTILSIMAMPKPHMHAQVPVC